MLRTLSAAPRRWFMPLLILVVGLTACSKKEGASADTFAKLPEGTAATVDGTPIPVTEVDQLVQVMVQQGFAPDSTTPGATPVERQRNFALDRLIDRTLVLNDARKRGLSADMSTVEQRFAQFKAQMGVGDSLPPGMDPVAIKKNLGDDLTISRYFTETVTDSLKVSPEEIAAYFNGNPEMFNGANRMRARHIMFQLDQSATPEQKAAARTKAEGVLARAKKGEDFAELARKYSEDPGSAPAGGDLNWFSRGQMVPQFDQAAFSLTPGGISEIVETPFGFHIIKAEEMAKPYTLEEVSPQLEQMLKEQKSQEAVQARVDALKANAKIRKSQPKAG